MLESYEREIRSLEGSLLEAEENLDSTRWVLPGGTLVRGQRPLSCRWGPGRRWVARVHKHQAPPCREVWHMQLDSSRNHIIMVNLWLSMISISVMATTILPAFFGMNLRAPLTEESTTHFYGVRGPGCVGRVRAPRGGVCLFACPVDAAC